MRRAGLGVRLDLQQALRNRGGRGAGGWLASAVVVLVLQWHALGSAAGKPLLLLLAPWPTVTLH